MTPERDDIFSEAREISDPAQRSQFVADACGDDAALRLAVEAMLQDAEKAAAFFESNETESNLSVSNETPGAVIGRYKLLEKIGEGGMGVVYMAEQCEPVLRKVALKIIKAGMDTRQVVARFEAERQALALMDHPNIAKVFDGGSTETGRPYFVMDLVPGLPITRFCDEAKLSTRERLELFLEVCSAIQHAHQKGIIHRDLKPSNVLVTMHHGVAHPMVIDFGVAKAIDQNLTEKTLFTNFGTLIGTPAYMSPEQAEMSKLDVDTRADIYSLGVLLYELLTGTTPFAEERLRSVAYGEMQRIIVEEEPERPSTRLKGRLAIKSEFRNPKSEIDSDLDWIVMKCLEKDRNRRFETASNMAADLTRFLNGEPVVARPPSSAYRLQKMVRRNKLQCAAAALVLLVLVVAVVVSRWQAVRATRAEQKARQQTQVAERESRQAEAVKNFLLENLKGVEVHGLSRELDFVAVESRKALLREVAFQMEGKFADQPRMEADIRMVIAEGFGAVKDFPAGASEAEKALAIRQQLLGPTHSNTLSSAALAAYQKAQLGQGQAAEQEQVLSDYVKLLRQSPQGFPAGGEVVLATYGMVLSQNGRAAEGLPYLREALEVSAPTRETYQRLRGYFQGRMAFGYFKEDGIPSESAPLDEAAPLQFAMAQLRMERNPADEAWPGLERVVTYARQRMGRDHSYTLDCEYWLGQAYEQQKRVDRAAELYTDIYPRWIKLLPNDTAVGLCGGIAKFFVRHQRFHEARAIFEALRETFDANPAAATEHWATYVQATAATKGWQAAVQLYRKRVAQVTNDVASWRTLGILVLYGGGAEGYGQVVAQALALAPTLAGWEDQQNLLSIASLGTNALSPEQLIRCEALVQSVEQALATATESKQGSAHRELGGILLRLGRLRDSLTHLDQAADRFPSGIDRARVLILKTICLYRLSRVGETRAAFDEADAIMQSGLLNLRCESEGFLTVEEDTYLIHRREAHGLLYLK
jgi:tetratricopeptide (TPR) repeat protein